MFVAIAQLEIQSIETCQILPVCVYPAVYVFRVMLQDQSTFVGVSARTSTEQRWY